MLLIECCRVLGQGDRITMWCLEAHLFFKHWQLVHQLMLSILHLSQDLLLLAACVISLQSCQADIALNSDAAIFRPIHSSLWSWESWKAKVGVHSRSAMRFLIPSLTDQDLFLLYIVILDCACPCDKMLLFRFSLTWMSVCQQVLSWAVYHPCLLIARLVLEQSFNLITSIV